MELIILFVLFMIISSIVRALGQGRSQQGGAGPKAPPPVTSPPLKTSGDAEDAERTEPKPGPSSRPRMAAQDGMVGAEDMSYYQPAQKRKREPSKGGASRDYPSREKAAPAVNGGEIGSSPKRGPKKTSLSRPLTEDTFEPRQELSALLGSSRVTMGIVVSEVLSAPRAKRPHRKDFR